jgi:hypothetical protein
LPVGRATQLFDLNAFAVDTKLAEVLEGDDPIRRQILANSVEQLEEDLRWAARSTIEKATRHFLTGLRRRGRLLA